MEKDCETKIPEQMKERLEKGGGLKGVAKNLQNDKEYTEKAKIHKALSDPNRLKILDMLSKQPLCVCIIKEILKLPNSKLSYHLSILKENQLIKGTRQNNWITYEITEKGKKVL